MEKRNNCEIYPIQDNECADDICREPNTKFECTSSIKDNEYACLEVEDGRHRLDNRYNSVIGNGTVYRLLSIGIVRMGQER
jgi:hypothetical protein